MTGRIVNSDDARTRWRDILDAANRREDVVIARYGKPTAVVIPIADYEALREELEDLRAAPLAADPRPVGCKKLKGHDNL